MKPILGSIALGVTCFAIVAALNRSGATEGEIWGAWLCTTAIAAALAGHCWPKHALRNGLLIMMTQPPCILAAFAAAGEISNPGSSTGGLVAVGICSMILFAWAPVPLLLGRSVARARLR